MPRCSCAVCIHHRATRPPWLCRMFGHRMMPMLTDQFWVAVEHRCVRCGETR